MMPCVSRYFINIYDKKYDIDVFSSKKPVVKSFFRKPSSRQVYILEIDRLFQETFYQNTRDRLLFDILLSLKFQLYLKKSELFLKNEQTFKSFFTFSLLLPEDNEVGGLF